MALAAMVALRFDVRAVRKEWVVPSTTKAGMTSVMPAPDFDVGVEIAGRKGDARVIWMWVLSGGAGRREEGEE
jgi:hypothetical protein